MSTFNGYTIFEKIKFLVDKNKTSIRQVALNAGFKSPNAIYRYKEGVTPREASIEAIANALRTTPAFLKGETDDWNISAKDNKETIVNDEAEQKMLTMFRKSTEGMSEDEKIKFQRSLSKLMDVAKDFNSGK